MSDSQPQVRTRKGIGFLFPASKWIVRKLNCLNIAAHLPHQSGFIDAYVLANFIFLAVAGLMLSLNALTVPEILDEQLAKKLA